jgi:LL-diaminopimelate aminotransferase
MRISFAERILDPSAPGRVMRDNLRPRTGKGTSTMEIKPAERLKVLPEYLFDELDRKKAEAQAKGVDVIDLGVGDPDLASPDYVVETLAQTARDPKNQHYPSFKGLPAFRKAAARWYEREFGVELDPDKETMLSIGSKIGISTVPMAMCDPGDVVLCPDPCYTAYHPGVTLLGNEIHNMPLRRENAFLPDLSEIPSDVAKRAKLMLLNYPNNPTAAVATPEFFADVVKFAEENDIVVISDAAYSQTVFNDQPPISFLAAPGAKEVGIEFNSLSKTFNMTGWRLAFAAGNAEVIKALAAVKSNIDMGAFEPIQLAGVAALDGGMEFTRKMNEIYRRRRDVLIEGLEGLGWDVIVPKATFFCWLPIPEKAGMKSIEFAGEILDKAGIVLAPGIAFGQEGDDYIRIAVTRNEDRIRLAIQRLKDAGFDYN